MPVVRVRLSLIIVVPGAVKINVPALNEVSAVVLLAEVTVTSPSRIKLPTAFVKMMVPVAAVRVRFWRPVAWPLRKSEKRILPGPDAPLLTDMLPVSVVLLANVMLSCVVITSPAVLISPPGPLLDKETAPSALMSPSVVIVKALVLFKVTIPLFPPSKVFTKPFNVIMSAVIFNPAGAEYVWLPFKVVVPIPLL